MSYSMCDILVTTNEVIFTFCPRHWFLWNWFNTENFTVEINWLKAVCAYYNTPVYTLVLIISPAQNTRYDADTKTAIKKYSCKFMFTCISSFLLIVFILVFATPHLHHICINLFGTYGFHRQKLNFVNKVIWRVGTMLKAKIY